MPSATFKYFVNKTGKTEKEIETLWNKAKDIVKDQYKIKETDNNFYQIVMGVVKKMLSLTEEEGAPAITTSTMGDYVYRNKFLFQKRFDDKKKKKKKTVGIYDPSFAEE
jgi:hypothetical protein